MGLAKVMMAIKGKFLKETAVNTKVRLILFRNEQTKGVPLFQIQVELPQGRIYTLREYRDEKVARNEYEEMLERIRNAPNFFK